MASSTSDTVDLPDQDTLDALVSIAIDASRKAGDIILGNAGGAEITESKANSRDLLTLLDPLCEKTIRETILEEYPQHDFLGEESVAPGPEASAAALAELSSKEWLWIVDPIDGTTNFVHGMPLCMPSIACAYKGHVVAAVIFDVHRNEMFSATRGGGAFVNGEKMKVGGQSQLSDAVVAMGSPPGEVSMDMSLKGIQTIMPLCRTIRMLGSAALMLAWVAQGRLTAYWEYDLSSWDVAAGSLLIEEAGGRITNLENEKWTIATRKICASNGGMVHTQLLEALETAGVK